MDQIGSALLYGTNEVEHFMKKAAVVDSWQNVLKNTRTKIQKGMTVASALQEVADSYPGELANKVASEIRPCDHLLGIMWADASLFKNSSDLRTFVKQHPYMSTIQMTQLPHGSYWKQASVHRSIPNSLYEKKVSTNRDDFPARLRDPNFHAGLLAHGILSKGASQAIQDGLSGVLKNAKKEDISYAKIAQAMESFVKEPKTSAFNKASSVGLEMDGFGSVGMEAELAMPEMDGGKLSVGNDIFSTLGTGELDLDLIGASNEKLSNEAIPDMSKYKDYAIPKEEAPGRKESEGVFAFEDKTKISHVNLVTKAKSFKTSSEFVEGIRKVTPGKVSSIDETALIEFYKSSSKLAEKTA